jgi:hypothetical protein
MRLQIFISRLALVATCILQGPAWAGEPSTIPLHYGVNQFPFDGGAEGMAVLAHRENFNAHGFDVLTLYLKPKGKKADVGDWQFLSLFDGEKEALTLTAGGGADCMLHDFRLLQSAGPVGVQLIVAEREPGSSYVDSAPVHFKFYTLRQNSSAEPGRPLAYFQLARTTKAKASYCDVGEAFVKELGIQPYR